MIRRLHAPPFAGFVFFVVAAWLWAILPARAADGILDIDQTSNALSLASSRTAISAARPKIAVQPPNEAKPADLLARGPGPTYYWSLFSFRNISENPLDLVLATYPQRFAGSGVVHVAPPGHQTLGAILTRDAKLVDPRELGSLRVFPVQLQSKEMLNVAIEGKGAALEAVLWQPSDLQKAVTRQTFLVGFILGFSLLVSLGMLATYAFRPNRPSLFAWLFGLAVTAFVAFDAGLLPDGQFTAFTRVVIESAMLASLALCIPAFLRLDIKSSPFVLVFFVIPFLAFANIAFGWVEPLAAASVARFGFAAVVVAGFVATLVRRKSDVGIVDPSMLFWTLLFAWSVFAAVASQDQLRAESLTPILDAVLVVVLVAMALVVLRYVFAQGLAAKPFITDQSRRSLALASGGHVFWDWQPGNAVLSVGDELALDLGYASERWGTRARGLFKEIIHPLDAAAYSKIAERRDYVAGDIIEMDLRLRDSDGKYRWFGLQATAVPGPNDRVDRCIGTLTDISKLKQTEERLASDALQDVVTGLPNRALLHDRLERALGKVGGLPQRAIVIDLDRFKLLNEGLGEEQGDKLLKVAAGRLTALLDSDETVARLGGSQFGIACAETIERGDFKPFVEKLTEALSDPINLGLQQIVLTASVGVSPSGTMGTKAGELLDQANVAMLQARGEGGARVVNYKIDMKDERAKLLSLESDLRRAITQGEIEIYFQPIAYLATLGVAGFEALARWRHPTLGLLPPADFIEIAETTGLISEIGNFVLSGAARQLGIWQRVMMQGRPFFVSVNVSVNQLLAPDFMRQVTSVIEREGIEPGSLKIEITETLLMRQPERAGKILKQLQARGVGLACDDFGTGFSSLSSLRDLPFDTLKIDRSFIAPDNFDQRNGMIISSICSLARGLGMTVVAEGIENQTQIDKLAEFGCGLGQGYFIGEPDTAQGASDKLAVLHSARPERSPSFVQPNLNLSRSLYEPQAPKIEDGPYGLFEDDAPDILPSIFTLPKQAARTKAKRKVAKKTKSRRRR